MFYKRLLKKLIRKAIKKENGDVHPCGCNIKLKDSFRIDEEIRIALLYYEKDNKSTGLVICPLCKKSYEIYKRVNGGN